MQHAVMAARALVSKGSDTRDRARMLGYVGVAYGIGFAIGPMAGGILSNTNLKNGAAFATAGSVLSALLVWGFLPRDTAVGASGTPLIHEPQDDHRESSFGRLEEGHPPAAKVCNEPKQSPDPERTDA